MTEPPSDDVLAETKSRAEAVTAIITALTGLGSLMALAGAVVLRHQLSDRHLPHDLGTLASLPNNFLLATGLSYIAVPTFITLALAIYLAVKLDYEERLRNAIRDAAIWVVVFLAASIAYQLLVSHRFELVLLLAAGGVGAGGALASRKIWTIESSGVVLAQRLLGEGDLAIAIAVRREPRSRSISSSRTSSLEIRFRFHRWKAAVRAPTPNFSSNDSKTGSSAATSR